MPTKRIGRNARDYCPLAVAREESATVCDRLPRSRFLDNVTFRSLKTTDAIQCPPSDNFRFAPKEQRALATSHPETSVIAPTPTGRRIRRFRWNYGQDNLRGMLCVQVDCVAGDLRAAVVVERVSPVLVCVEAGEDGC